jgi:cytoskeletal protein CcmA (bactofilin family)
MSNLSNLHISGSYLGLINLADSTQSLPSQSGDINLQDGVGNNIGLKINAQTNDVTIDNKLVVQSNLTVNGNTDLNGNLDVSGSFIHSGSIDIKGNVTVDGDISANIATFDTVNTRLLHVTEESASVIFSSGSNVIGDETSDTQTIVGQTTISGSLGVTGTQTNTGNLSVSGEISSSTVNGIGNVTTYSASVDSRLDALEGPFSTSVDSRLDSLETFETSQQARNATLATYTGSVDSSLASINSFTSSTDSSLNAINSFTSSTDSSLTSINAFTQSADTRITNLENFSSSAEGLFVNETDFNTYTQSVDVEQTAQNNRLNSLEAFTQSLSVDFVETAEFNAYTQSTNTFTASADNRLTQIELTTQSLDNKVDRLIAVTGSYATTGSNTFNGDQIITGSVNGNVEALTITSQTASIDCSTGNFFTLNLPTGSTQLAATNITPGQTISVRLGSDANRIVTFDDSIQFPSGVPYTPSVSSSYDLLTFVTFDSSHLYGVAVNLFNR